VQTADVKMAGEKASAVPIQVLSDTAFKVADRCAGFGLPSANTVDSLGANGILGIGVFEQDCGDPCVQSGSSNPGLYYECPTSTSCVPTGEALAQQVQNPVALFSSDNNGVIIEFPAVSAPAATVSGSLVFGIGTQSNNALGGATVYTVDGKTASFTSSYKGVSYSQSFIDSGSNGYFFLDSGITSLPDCSVDQGFYCPSTPQALTATNQGVNKTSGTVNFTIANAETLLGNSTDTVFGELGGPDTFPGTQSGPSFFDWGLPFFYGRNVYTAIETKSTPGGTGPYWAY
jgi:hypothetical protein